MCNFSANRENHVFDGEQESETDKDPQPLCCEFFHRLTQCQQSCANLLTFLSLRSIVEGLQYKMEVRVLRKCFSLRKLCL